MASLYARLKQSPEGFPFHCLPRQTERLLRHMNRSFYFREEPFKGVLRAFLYHTEH
jgi:hypothetical protein